VRRLHRQPDTRRVPAGGRRDAIVDALCELGRFGGKTVPAGTTTTAVSGRSPVVDACSPSTGSAPGYGRRLVAEGGRFAWTKLSYACAKVLGVGEDRLSALAACRPWAMSADELVAALDQAQALRVEVEAVTLRLLRQIEKDKVASSVSASSTAVWYRNRHLVSIRSAHRFVKVARRVDAAPAVVGEAVADGRVNLDQADVVTRALARIPAEVGVDIRERAAETLVRWCAELDPEQLRLVGDRILSFVAPEIAEEFDRRAMERDEAQALRERYLTMVPDGVGVRLSGRLTHEGAAIVRAAIDPLTAPTSYDDRSAGQRRADALVDVCRLALATTQLPANGGDRPQVFVSVDFDVLKQQLGPGTLATGERVTPETARRIACAAGIVPLTLNSQGQPLDVGRRTRVVPGAIRRALLARDRGCAFPGCDRDGRWADVHHIRHWSHGGPTAMENLVLLCSYHHGEIHRPDGWTVFMATDGIPSFVPPSYVDPERKPRRDRFHRRE
jgi:hypothetical protein